MRTCSCCGNGYKTRGSEDILIYGCRACHLGSWTASEQELKKIEIDKVSLTSLYPYGNPLEWPVGALEGTHSPRTGKWATNTNQGLKVL